MFSILLNVALIVRLSGLAWLRVAVWNIAGSNCQNSVRWRKLIYSSHESNVCFVNILGFLVYFLYGIHQSVEGDTHNVKDNLTLNGIQPSKLSEEPDSAVVQESDNLSNGPPHTNKDL